MTVYWLSVILVEFLVYVSEDSHMLSIRVSWYIKPKARVEKSSFFDMFDLWLPEIWLRCWMKLSCLKFKFPTIKNRTVILLGSRPLHVPIRFTWNWLKPFVYLNILMTPDCYLICKLAGSRTIAVRVHFIVEWIEFLDLLLNIILNID